MSKLTKLSLFSGIGGDDLASEWAGIETVCFVENDKFCQQVLKKHWPDTPIIGDIHDVTKEKFKEVTGREWVDIIVGGDPCQPRSIAGQRRGREDDRDLWPDMFRVICELKPTWVVNENPTGRLTMDFYEVLSDLESQGYETRSFVIPACGVNAPHRRDRLYIVGHASRGIGQSSISRTDKRQVEGYDTTSSHSRLLGQEKSKQQTVGSEECDRDASNTECAGAEQGHGNTRQPFAIGRGDCIPATDTEAEGLQGLIASTWEQGQELRDQSTGRCYRAWRANWPEVATTFCRVDDGLPHRVVRLKALGNAQVPQQVYPIYKAIMEIEKGK